MPPRISVFKTMGSQDGVEVETTGGEIFTLLKYFKPRLLLIVAILGSIGSGVIPCLMYLFIGDFTTGGADANFEIVEAIKPTIIKMVYINIAMIFVQMFAFVTRSRATPQFAARIRNKIYEVLMNQPIDYFDKASTGVLISRLSEDITLIRETYVDKFMQIIQNTVQAIGGVILAFTTSWLVSLTCLVAIPIVLLTFWLGEKFIDKLWYKYNENSTSAASKAEEVITQFRTVKAFDGEMKEYELYNQSLKGVDDVYKTTSIAHGVKDGVITLVANLLIAGVMYLTSYLVIKKPEAGLESGDLMVLMMSLMLATMGITQVFGSFDDFRKANISARKLIQIIELPMLDRNKGNTLDKIDGKIEFKNVGFKYSTRVEYAVKDLSFTINQGETVALVGESGCGKTTTLQLLQRFYDVTEGEILIDGHNINDLSPVYLRSNIAIVPQTPVLFSMSISDNIRYGKADATDDEVARAAEVGNAHDFIMNIKDNYKTEVQQTSLSGGQKQRVCISRAILADTPILLLDEATAALDTESEQLVQKSLENVRRGKTAIVVAHRLATVKNADRILVFSNGKVVESGKHDELIEKEGIYADLVKYQLQ
jgi:ABC-type multidrug transport system fused ATPase/permease subunit